MKAVNAGVKSCLKSFDFQNLFFNELGWDRPRIGQFETRCGTSSFFLEPIAEKRGIVAFLCRPSTGGILASSSERRLVERSVAKQVHEHIIIYTDHAETTQIWQWVRREPNRPIATREHRFSDDQDGEALAQKLEKITFNLKEEENLTLTEVAERVQAAFDIDKVTKKFYLKFKLEHSAFQKLIRGIRQKSETEWYTSLMLSRLMFVYFVQKKGFLNGDHFYLQNKLAQIKSLCPKKKRPSFYNDFLIRLFHEGLGSPTRTNELGVLLGRVPYLNGGLFELHELEKQYEKIQIPDEAFARLFTFFESYHWHLNDHPIAADNEINPDVLGYIFENYVNQKQMGAYYTKEDITEYICRNSIFPWLLSQAKLQKPEYFGETGPIWDLLVSDPDRYIYPSLFAGVTENLPASIEEGVENPAKRSAWNQPCEADKSLATETWREFICRRTRYYSLLSKIESGQIKDIDSMIENNLNITQFVQDVVENCDDIHAFGVFFALVSRVKILDPTCGSGAFVFAALNLLEPVYDSCIEKVQIIFAEVSASDINRRRELRAFQGIIKALNEHPNREFFIAKSIILNNLYGVDIMKEAVEICKLRLFLKLAAQVSSFEDIEPLPDIDFNFKSGNTLIGILGEAELKSIFNKDEHQKILKVLDQTQIEYRTFKSLQNNHNANAAEIAKVKSKLAKDIRLVSSKLDLAVAAKYDYRPRSQKSFQIWKENHRPFHWISEFFGIIKSGGFDVVIGNPPYIEWKDIKEYKIPEGTYNTLNCGNIYTSICERSYDLMNPHSRFGMIVPISCVATDRMTNFRDEWSCRRLATYVSHYSGDAHPSVLFEGVKFRLSILLQHAKSSPRTYATHFQRWYAQGRSNLFSLINYNLISSEIWRMGLPPKLGEGEHVKVLEKLFAQKRTLKDRVLKQSEHEVYAHRIVAHFVKAFDSIPFFKNERDGQKKSEDYKVYAVSNEPEKQALCAVLNSSLFYVWFVTYSDVYHCGRELILDFPCNLEKLVLEHGEQLALANRLLMNSLSSNCIRRNITYEKTGLVEYDEFYPRRSKNEIDSIDIILGQFYGFSQTELDFIISFDNKFRIGQTDED